jgi:hypothetical protein
VEVVGCEAACWAMLVAGFFESNLWIKSFWTTWMMLLLVTRLMQRQQPPTVIAKPWMYAG